MTIADWINLASEKLATANVESPGLEARVLAQESIQKTHEWILTHSDSIFDSTVADSWLLRRLSGEPLPYIVGHKEFYGRRFDVSPAVLIPRADTEVLVDACLAMSAPTAFRVLDVGTGSGVIAITLNLERPSWTVEAIDISVEALNVAKSNAKSLNADVAFHCGDLFPNVDLPWDIVVSNPPYVAYDDTLGAGVKEFEPNLALFAEDNGLLFYKRLAEELHGKTAMVMVEIGQGQETEVIQIFESNGWPFIHMYKDLSQINRVLFFGHAR